MNNAIFQTEEWAEFKLATGYSGKYWLDDILVLERKLPLGRSMLYSPMVKGGRWKAEGFIDQIHEIANKSGAIFYRLELDQLDSPSFYSLLSTLHFQKSFEEMQPEHTLILDISKSEEEILEQMKQKGRYNIRVAAKHDVVISVSDKPGNELNQFYSLYEKMAKRQRISCRDKRYFEALLEITGEKGYTKVYTAYTTTNDERPNNERRTEEPIPLAAAVICFYNKRATYLFGGSSDEHRNLMAPYLLHWQIIKDARTQGCTEYDMFGVAPTDDPKHPWAGVTRFKNQFGGKQVDLLGSWDLVFRPVEYEIFKLAERLRR